jgi:hypothetical protein
MANSCGTNTTNSTNINAINDTAEFGSLDITSKDVDNAYIKLLEFAIELPEQMAFWNELSVVRFHPLVVYKEHRMIPFFLNESFMYFHRHLHD